MENMKKKKSPREKGNAYQVWIRNWLEERGWTVRNFPVISRPPILIPDKEHPGKMKQIWLHQDNDVFGCDLIAMKRRVRLWIQSSLDEHIAKRLAEFSKYFTALGPFEGLMIWIKREKWHSIKKVTIGDEREMRVVDVGKIQVGKFYPAEGTYFMMFGEKIKKKKEAKNARKSRQS